MENFKNYINICFNNIECTIELPNNLEELNNARFYSKENLTKDININPKEIKELLKILSELKNISLIYCQKSYKYEQNLIDYIDNEELNKTNLFYNDMKRIDEEENKKNKHDVYIPNESEYFTNSIFKKAKEKNNTNNTNYIKSINDISEIPEKKENSNPSTQNNIKEMIQNINNNENKKETHKIFINEEKNNQNNEKKLLEEKISKLKDELNVKENIIKKLKKPKINSVELLTVPGINEKMNLVRESGCFTYNFNPEINYSCYGVYECSKKDINLIINYILPNIYSILKSELLILEKKEKINSEDYVELFKKCYNLMNETLILSQQTKKNQILQNNLESTSFFTPANSLKNIEFSDLSFSFLLFSDEKIISVNLGNSKIKKFQDNLINNKIESISLSEENQINNNGIIYTGIIELDCKNNKKIEIKIKICPNDNKDKFIIMGNYQFLENILDEDFENIYNKYNKNSKEVIKELYKICKERNMAFNNNYIGDISAILIFLD